MNTFHLVLCALLAWFANLAVCNSLRHSKRSQIQNLVDLDTSAVSSRELPADEMLDPSDAPYCFESEPCQFVLTKKNPKDNMPIRKTIPSWCRCRPMQQCSMVHYDRRKKMDVHQCKDINDRARRSQNGDGRRRLSSSNSRRVYEWRRFVDDDVW